MAMRDETTYMNAGAPAAAPADEILAATIILLGLAAFVAAGVAISILLDRLIGILAHLPMPTLGG